MKRTIMYSVYWLVCCLRLTAQDNIKALPPLKDVTGIHFLKETNELLRITSTQMPSEIIASGPFAGNKVLLFSQAIVFQSGRSFRLKDKEMIMGFYGSNFITKEDAVSDESAVIRRYTISSGNVVLTGQLSAGYENTAYILNNGNVLLADETENFGRKYTLFNKEMKQITKVEPFAEGFFTSIFKEADGKINFVFKESEQGNLQLVSIDAATGRQLNNVQIRLNDLYPQALEVTADGIILFGSNRLVSIAASGSINWNKEINLPNVDLSVFNSGQNILLGTSEGLVCINSTSGETNWQVPFAKLYHQSLISNMASPVVLRVIAMQPFQDGSKAALIIGQANQGELMSGDAELNNTLVTLDTKGSIVNHVSLSPRSYLLGLEENTKSVIVLSTQNIAYYEK